MGADTSYGKETVLGNVDLVSRAEVRELAGVTGPCVSVLLPTPRLGPGVVSGPARLRHLLDEAADGLARWGVDEATAAQILAPHRDLVGDPAFWQHQGAGLALFAAPGYAAHFRLPVELPEEVAVGASFRLRQLVSMAVADGGFFLLALAQNSVRLFHATRHTIGEIALGAIPGSMAEAIPQEEMERYGQAHSTGPTTQFHGQGNEADYDKAALERYFRAIDHPLTARLQRLRQPLVLACVAYYVPIYTAVSTYPQVWPEAVEGNPEHRTAKELHDAAWPLLADHVAEREAALVGRYRQRAGTGKALADPHQIAQAASVGQVDTLLLAGDRAALTDSDEEVVDVSVAQTLRHDGDVVTVGEAAGLDAAVAALLRF